MTMQGKKIPLRTCIACREEKPKREMLRIVRSSDGTVSLDFSGKMAGRGAYICTSKECAKKLGQKKLLHKAFSCPVDEEVYKRIEEELLGR